MIPREEKIKLTRRKTLLVILRSAVCRKTLPQQNRIESLYNNRNALEKKLVSQLSPLLFQPAGFMLAGKKMIIINKLA